MPLLGSARCVLLRILILVSLLPGLVYGRDSSVEVGVAVEKGWVLIDASLFVEVSPELFWQVLIDFDGMKRFLSNLKESRVLSREGNRVRFYRAGTDWFGPFPFDFESVNEMVLNPCTEIDSQLISGDLKSFHSTKRVVPDGRGTRLIYHAEAEPDSMLHLSIGRVFFKSLTRKHLQEIADEALRRQVRMTPGEQHSCH